MNAAMTRATLVAALLAFGLLLSLSSPVGAQSSGAKVYWTEYSAGNIKRANLDGSSVETALSSAGAAPDHIEVDLDGGKFYWLSINDTKRVQRANLDGSGKETLVSHGSYGDLCGMAVDGSGGKLYWMSYSQNKIWRSNLDGTSAQTIVSTSFDAECAMAVDGSGGKIYWVANDRIHRANLDGSSSETIVSSGLSSVNGIDVGGGKIYWPDATNDTIKRANLDGSSVETIVSSELGAVYDIAVDASGGKIYWPDATNNTIKRANLDGSSIETIVSSGLSNSRGIAVPTRPNVPRVSVTSVTESTMVLDWDDIEDATDYQYRYKDSSENTWGDEVTVSESTALVTELTAGTSYDFQARSRESGTPNDWSGTVSVTTSAVNPDISRLPAQVKGLSVVSQGTDAAQLQWQHQSSALDYEVGLWQAGLIHEVSTLGATATVTIPEVWIQIIESVGFWSGSSYPEFDPDQPYVGVYDDDPAKVIMLHHREYTGDILYYWNTDLGRWRVLQCKASPGESCNYGTPSSTDTRTLVTVSSSVFSWFTLDDGPPEWGGVYRNEDDALESAKSAEATVIFLDPLGYARYSRLNTATPSAVVTELPAGRQYISVRGVTSDGRTSEWANLVTVGAADEASAPVQGAPVALDNLIYTDEVPNIEHYLRDETTLILNWQNLPGARHYDVRTNSKVTRIETLASSAQQTALSLASLQGQTVEYQVRAVIETGVLDVRVRDSEGTLIYIVPPNSVAYSRWSAARSVNVEQLGMISGPGTGSLLVDPGPPDDIITGLIADVLKISTLLDEDADDGDVQVWTLPLGLLGSIFLGGLTGYGAGRGRLDKAAIVAGGLVFFVCWGYLCPVYLHIPWQVVISVFVLVIGAALVIAINDYLR